jgi:hypothetical protein
LTSYYGPEWEGLASRIVDRWTPSLTGNTGLQLPSTLGRSHGTLTNFANNGNDAYVTSPDKLSLNFNGTNNFAIAPIPNLSGTRATLSAWVRGVPGSGTGYIVSAPKASGGSNGLDFRSPSNVIFDVVMQSGLIVLTSGIDIRESWHHLCGGCDGTRVFFFVNGTLVASQANTGTLDTAYTSSEINLGRFGSFGSFAACQIDDVILFRDGLSPNDAQFIYDQGRGGGLLREPPKRRAFFVPALPFPVRRRSSRFLTFPG